MFTFMNEGDELIQPPCETLVASLNSIKLTKKIQIWSFRCFYFKFISFVNPIF